MSGFCFAQLRRVAAIRGSSLTISDVRVWPKWQRRLA